jgi:hypothetical protein
MLPIGLMLLDLIEMGVQYGTGTKNPQKVYTWEKMMSDPGNPKDRLWAGKHPMLHDATQNQATTMIETFNPVTKKAVSITVAWLACYLHASPNWTVTILREAPSPKDRDKGIKMGGDQLNKGKLNQIGSAVQQATQRMNVDVKPPLRANPYDFYVDVVKPALERRCATLDCLLTVNVPKYATA